MRGTIADVAVSVLAALAMIAALLVCAGQVVSFALAALMNWQYALLPRSVDAWVRPGLGICFGIATLPMLGGVLLAAGAMVRAPLMRRLPSTLTDQQPMPWRLVLRVVVGDLQRTYTAAANGIAPLFWLACACFMAVGSGLLMLQGNLRGSTMVGSLALSMSAAIALVMVGLTCGNWLIALIAIEEPGRLGTKRKVMMRYVPARVSLGLLWQVLKLPGALAMFALPMATVVLAVDHVDAAIPWLVAAWLVAMLIFIWRSMRQLPLALATYERVRGDLPWIGALGSPRLQPVDGEPDFGSPVGEVGATHQPTLRFTPATRLSTGGFWRLFVACPLVVGFGFWLAICHIWLSPQPQDDAWFRSQRDRLDMGEYDRGERPWGRQRAPYLRWHDLSNRVAKARTWSNATSVLPSSVRMIDRLNADPGFIHDMAQEAREWLGSHQKLQVLARHAAENPPAARAHEVGTNGLQDWVAIRLAASLDQPVDAPDGLLAVLREASDITRFLTDCDTRAAWTRNHQIVSAMVDRINARLICTSDMPTADRALIDAELERLDAMLHPYVDAAIREEVRYWQYVPRVRHDPFATMMFLSRQYELDRATRDRLAASCVTLERERRLNGMLTSATVTDTAILLERETRLRIRMLRLALRVGHWIRVRLRTHPVLPFVGSLETAERAAFVLTDRPDLSGIDPISGRWLFVWADPNDPTRRMLSSSNGMVRVSIP